MMESLINKLFLRVWKNAEEKEIKELLLKKGPNRAKKNHSIMNENNGQISS